MAKKRYRRTPKGYDGIASSHHHLQELLPGVLKGVGEVYKDRPDLILAAWEQVVGSSLAGMSEAVGFKEGILTVKVKNSGLLALMRQYERPKLLKKLREKFPNTMIRNITFRAG